MADVIMVMAARVEGTPGAMRELIVFRPGDTWEWRTGLPALLDQRPASATLVEYLVRLFQRQQPSKAALLGLMGLTAMVQLALAKANKREQEASDWAQEVA